jgi:hypothetical protein
MCETRAAAASSNKTERDGASFRRDAREVAVGARESLFKKNDRAVVVVSSYARRARARVEHRTLPLTHSRRAFYSKFDNLIPNCNIDCSMLRIL